jgi:hypothetical protein
LIVLVTSFSLSGCSTISKADCIVMDWFELGRTDGMSGNPRSTFQERAKPCLKRGVIPDRQAYYNGHDEGLAIYCTEQHGFDLGKKGLPYKPICPDDSGFRIGYDKGIQLYCTEKNGYSAGVNGWEYNHVCPPQLEVNFLKGYEKGRRLFEYRDRVKMLQNRLNHIQLQIRNKESFYNYDISDEQTIQLRSELRMLDIEYREVSRELRYATLELQDYEDSTRINVY